VKRAFQCPYHAWTYGLDGKLIAAPNLANLPGIDRAEYGLHAVRLREWLGDPESIERYGLDRLSVGSGSPTTSRRTGS